MIEDIIRSWKDTLARTPEENHFLTDALLAKCPRQAVNCASDRIGSPDYSFRLLRGVRRAFNARTRKILQNTLGKAFSPVDEPLLGLFHTSLLGTYRSRAVVLILLPPKKKPADFAASWSVRWELSTIAAATQTSRMHVLVTGMASQRYFEQFDCTVVPDPTALIRLMDPPAFRSSSCRKCSFLAVCDEADRQDPQPLPAPPLLSIDDPSKAVSGKALLRTVASISEKVVKYLVNRDQNRSLGYHPSTIGAEVEEQEPCLRVFYYQATGTPQDDTWRWLYLVFEMGHSWHDVIQAIARKADPEIGIEKRVARGRVTGHMDLRPKHAVVDIKSKSEKGGNLRGYAGQVNVYAWAEEFTEDPPREVVIVSCLKDTGALEATSYPINMEMQERISKATAEADVYVDADTLPPRFSDAEYAHQRCKACYYQRTCYKGG